MSLGFRRVQTFQQCDYSFLRHNNILHNRSEPILAVLISPKCSKEWRIWEEISLLIVFCMNQVTCFRLELFPHRMTVSMVIEIILISLSLSQISMYPSTFTRNQIFPSNTNKPFSYAFCAIRVPETASWSFNLSREWASWLKAYLVHRAKSLDVHM